MKRLIAFLSAFVMVAGCSGLTPFKVDDLEYHVLPDVRADPTTTASESLVATEGPYLVLHLREPGKPHFAKDMFVRHDGLEHVDSTAQYVFKVRIEHVMQGGSEWESYEIRSIYKNGKKIYP